MQFACCHISKTHHIFVTHKHKHTTVNRRCYSWHVLLKSGTTLFFLWSLVGAEWPVSESGGSKDAGYEGLIAPRRNILLWTAELWSWDPATLFSHMWYGLAARVRLLCGHVWAVFLNGSYGWPAHNTAEDAIFAWQLFTKMRNEVCAKLPD